MTAPPTDDVFELEDDSEPDRDVVLWRSIVVFEVKVELVPSMIRAKSC